MDLVFGAAFAALVVYFVGSLGREGLTPVKLTLAGAAMSALFSSLTQGMLSVNEAALEQALFWLAGSVQGATSASWSPSFHISCRHSSSAFYSGRKSMS